MNDQIRDMMEGLFDNVVTDEDIGEIADAIRNSLGVDASMTIPEMPAYIRMVAALKILTALDIETGSEEPKFITGLVIKNMKLDGGIF